MKNFCKLEVKIGKYIIYRLIDNEGNFVKPFDAFAERLLKDQRAPSTVKRYLESVGQFLDYLAEIDVLGQPCTQWEIHTAVEGYLPSRACANQSQPRNKFEAAVKRLGLRRLTNSSLQNTAAAINSFLRLSDKRAQLDVQISEWHSEREFYGEISDDMFASLSQETRNRVEVENLVRNSMLASVMRLNPDGLKKPNAHLSITSKQDSFEDKDFPAEFLMPLLDAAGSWRDRAFWALAAGAGLRSHEAAQITWPSVIVEQRKVLVSDPTLLRFGSQMPEEYTPRFKGRKFSETYIIPQLRDIFLKRLSNTYDTSTGQLVITN